MENIIAYDQKVLNQFAYVNYYRGSAVQIMRAVERELTKNPAKPQLEYMHIEGEGHAKFILPGHTKYKGT